MGLLNKVLENNKRFVSNRKSEGKDKPISSHAQQEALIFTCMDTRLIDLVEEAMGFKRGDVKVLKNAGNSIRENCDDVIRSISLGTIMMGLKEVFVVGHSDCGMAKQSIDEVKDAMLSRGISKEAINSIDLEKWSGVLKDERENVIEVVNKIKSSPFIPSDINIYGLLIDPYSGVLEVLINEDK